MEAANSQYVAGGGFGDLSFLELSSLVIAII